MGANNVLVITFTVCNLPDSQFTDSAINATTVEYKETFAAKFNVSVESITVTLERGDFCNDGGSTTRRLLQRPSKGNDQEATITIVFADAEDAKTAKSSACDEIAAEYPD